MSLGILGRSFLPAITLVALLQGCGGGGGGTTYPMPAITDIDGAATASGNAGSGFIVDGSGFGTLSGMGTTTGYTVDFRDATTNSVVATADYAGSGWTGNYIKAVVPNSGLTVGTTYKVTVTTPGGTSNAVSFLLVASVAFSPSTIAWASTSGLPMAIQGFPTMIAPISVTSGSTTTTTTHIYTFGGNTAASGASGASSANVAAVYSNTINDGTNGTTAGTLAGAWKTETNALPAGRGFAAGALANGFNSHVSGSGTVYVLGGLDATGTATSTVYYASLASDGSVGTWATTTALPEARYAFGAVIFRGHLYVAGGNDATSTPTATVYSAQINSDGTLGTWSTTLLSLAAPVAYHQLVATGGVLYVLGGTSTAAVDPTLATQSAASVPDVYYNSINPDGTLAGTSWTANPNKLKKAVEKNTVIAIGTDVLASGGLYSGSPGSTEEQYSTQSTTDASLGAFNGATGSNTISGTAGGYNFFNHSASLYVDPAGHPHVMILGGQTVGTTPTAVENGVWYMK